MTNPQTPLILRTRDRIRRVFRVPDSVLCTWPSEPARKPRVDCFVLARDTTAAVHSRLIRRFRAASSLHSILPWILPYGVSRSAQCAGTSQSMCTPCVLVNVTIPRSPPLSAVSWYCACTSVPTMSLALTGRGSVAETVDCALFGWPQHAQPPTHPPHLQALAATLLQLAATHANPQR